MRVAALSLAYNEADIIHACIKNWKGKVDKHLILVSSRPWNGSPGMYDGTVEIARKYGAEVEVRYWETEEEQRNWGLARLIDFDYVLIVDPDELYLEEDQKVILSQLQNPYDYINRTNEKAITFRVAQMATYWKSLEHVLDPPDRHKPEIAVDPKRGRFFDKRSIQPADGSSPIVPTSSIIPVTCHHLSWVMSDEMALEKIETYSHANDIAPGWYENVWKAWRPGSTSGVRPYGVEQSIAIYRPAPQEILNLLSA